MTTEIYVEAIVWTAANDFKVEEGYFVIEKSILDMLDDPDSTVEDLMAFIELRAEELGHKLEFHHKVMYDYRYRDEVIEIAWRPSQNQNDSNADESSTAVLDARNPGSPMTE